jgi:hypothetical protein
MRVIKSMRIICTGHAARIWVMKIAYGILVGKPQWKKERGNLRDLGLDARVILNGS